MKTLLTLLVAALVGALMAATLTTANVPSHSWRLAYAHDGEGNALEGSKEALLAAIRDGKPVRVYFGMGRVEHTVDAGFITIFKGEVFAQMRAITGQKPMTDPAVTIELRDNSWQKIFATNGDWPLKWFVQN